MDLGYRGTVALVTGGSSGIGQATAHELAHEGAHVVLTYRSNRASAERIVDRITRDGGSAVVVRYDLDDHEQITTTIDQIVADRGRLDLLVANAVAWPNDRPNQRQGGSEWREPLRTNLEGTLHTVQAALPHLVAGRGRIVIVSSTIATDGMPGASTYAAAKAALHGLAVTLAVEHGPAGVLTNVVLPGLTLTERAHRLIPKPVRDAEAERTPTRRLSGPDDVARAIAFLGAPVNRQVTGQLIRVTGGL